MPNLEEAIRERAYHLWIADGQPDGKADIYWLNAQHEILTTSVESLASTAAAVDTVATKPAKRARVAGQKPKFPLPGPCESRRTGRRHYERTGQLDSPVVVSLARLISNSPLRPKPRALSHHRLSRPCGGPQRVDVAMAPTINRESSRLPISGGGPE